MSDHGHAAAGRFGWAALGLLLFAGLEAAIAVISHNPAMLADAGHNLSDAFLAGIGGAVAILTRGSSKHAIWCTVPKLVAAAICAFTILLIAAFVFGEAGQTDQLLNPWLIIPVSLASFALNWQLGGYLHHEHDHLARASSLHLKSDAWLSLALIPGGLLTYWTGSAVWNISVAFIVLLYVAWHNGREALESVRSIHPEEHHTHPGHTH